MFHGGLDQIICKLIAKLILYRPTLDIHVTLIRKISDAFAADKFNVRPTKYFGFNFEPKKTARGTSSLPCPELFQSAIKLNTGDQYANNSVKGKRMTWVLPSQRFLQNFVLVDFCLKLLISRFPSFNRFLIGLLLEVLYTINKACCLLLKASNWFDLLLSLQQLFITR